MKISLTILTILIPVLSFSQNNLEERIENLPISIHSGCDTVNHRTKWGMQLGELGLEFKIQTAEKNGDQISIVGYVRERLTEDPLANTQIFTATYQGDSCDIFELLATTDKNGRFEIEFENSENLSLFFRALSYRGLELKIGALKQ